MDERPHFKDNPLYLLLREGRVDEFNRRHQAGDALDMTHADFRHIDLRGIHADGIDFSHCYFHQADLRGVNFRKAKLDGASINGARISGCYFPEDVSASEITLSLLHGTRMRYGM